MATRAAAVEVGCRHVAGDLPPAGRIDADDTFRLLILQQYENPLRRETLWGMVERIRLHRRGDICAPARIEHAVAEHAFLHRAIVEPMHQLTAGYEPNMPAIPMTNRELESLIAYIDSATPDDRPAN